MTALLVHLRLHFQLLLAPIFLWGYLLAGGQWTETLVLSFVAFHVFNYGGGTAFNSYYDRDEGPIGGLQHPPPVEPALLPFALAMQVAGWALTLAVGAAVAAVYGLMFALFLAYSHPAIRLKAGPLRAMFTVAFGQGVLGFAAGWLTARGDPASLASVQAVAGCAAATLLTTGLYPLTGLYQVDVDRARGDRTAAVAWGVARCFSVALALLAAAGLTLALVVARRYGAVELLVFLAFYVVLLWLILRWRGELSRLGVMGNYRRIMRLNTVAAAGFAAYILYHLTRH
jgi:1,4-dihydroxy-2-naphthoate octaprenyltransferase